MDVGQVPAGAREILIKEVAASRNFLALRGGEPGKYYLNGRWKIQYDGDYQIAGTTFTYERKDNLEKLTAPGPTNESIWIQVPARVHHPSPAPATPHHPPRARRRSGDSHRACLWPGYPMGAPCLSFPISKMGPKG